MSDHLEDPYAAAGDVTSRRLAQTVDALADVQMELDRERLQREQSESLLDRLFGSLSDAVLVIDPRGVISRANQAAAVLFGRPPGELEGASARDLYRGDVPCTPWELLEASPEGHLSRETVAVSAEGSERQVSLSCAVVRDPDGRLHGAIHAARDLSEVHRLLHEVAAAEQRWRVLAHVGRWFTEALEPDEIFDGLVAGLEEDSGLGIALVLSDAGVVSGVHVSPGVADEVGLTAMEGTVPPRGSAVASAISDGRTIHAPTVDNGFPLLGPPSDAIGSAAVLALQTTTEPLGAMVVVSPEPGRVDDPTFTLMEEVASRIALNLANARLRERLVEHRAAEEATRYRDEILAAVSHDMKTPLAVLGGFVDMLEQSSGDHDPEELEKVHDSIGRQVRRLRRLTTQFLDYVRTEAGHELSLSLRPVDPEPLVRSVASSLSHSGRVEVDLVGLPPVLADESRLDLALANLVSNALKYAPGDTPVTITGQVVGPLVEISVSDQGPGIPPNQQAHLFDRFMRGPGDTGVEGSGLGLYMTRHIMRSQGGEVRAASRPGQGSRFTLILRRADVAGESDAEAVS